MRDMKAFWRRRRDLCVTLSRSPTEAGSSLSQATAGLHELFGAERATIHRPIPNGAGYDLEFQYTSGFSQAQRLAHVKWLAMAEPFMAYDPHRPEQEQRNLVCSISEPTFSRRDSVAKSHELFVSVRMNAFSQHRVVACDGSVLLAWVGVMRDRALSDTERRAFSSLVPHFVQALRIERCLREARVTTAGLAAALESIDAPAFIVSHGAIVKFANTVGRRMLDADVTATREQLSRVTVSAEERAADEADVTELGLPGMPRSHLVILRRAGSFGERLKRAQEDWSLTPRQAEVLALVARGDANKDIAHRLNCAARTVEAHLTALLRASGTRGRVELVSKLLTLR